MAGIDGDHILMEHADASIETNTLPNEVKSDVEDGASHNLTSYSYSDNGLFSNEKLQSM